MVIQNSAASTDLTASTAASAAAPTTKSNLEGLANETTFLQLLVSQIKNQDPLNPTDSAQFLGQLTQMSQLEQLVAIRQKLDTNSTALTDPASSSSGGAVEK